MLFIPLLFIEADCSLGYFPVGQSCMIFNSLEESYEDAAAVCAADGARLASPRNQGLISNIHQFANGAIVWVGKYIFMPHSLY